MYDICQAFLQSVKIRCAPTHQDASRFISTWLQSDKTLLFRRMTIEKFSLWAKDKVTTTYVASGWIAVQRLFRNIGWSKVGPSRNGNHGVFPLFCPNPGTPLCKILCLVMKNHSCQKREIGFSGSFPSSTMGRFSIDIQQRNPYAQILKKGILAIKSDKSNKSIQIEKGGITRWNLPDLPFC